MAREIRVLSHDPATIAAMERIGIACFGEHYRGGRLADNWRLGDERTRFFGVHEGERLIAYNGFLAHQARIAGRETLVFQSCHSATDPQFRGQGLFTTIIDHAKSELPGHAIIGFPNDQSRPIFLKRLGFSSVGQARLWLPCLGAGLLLDARLLARSLADRQLCQVDQRHVAQWKKREWPGALVEHDSNGNYLWGRVRPRKLGPASFRFLDAGGFDIANPRRLAATLADAGRQLGVVAARLLCTTTSAMAVAARIKLGARPNNVFIWYPLEPGPASGEARFDASWGMHDTW